MVDGGQAPEIPEHFQYSLPCYAAWKLFQRDQSPISLGLANQYRAEWQEWVESARAFRNPLTLDQPTQIDDAMGYLSTY